MLLVIPTKCPLETSLGIAWGIPPSFFLLISQCTPPEFTLDYSGILLHGFTESYFRDVSKD